MLVYAKKYAWKSELDALVYAAHETDPCRVASENPAWLCRQHRVKRFLLRPNAANVVLRLVAARSFRVRKMTPLTGEGKKDYTTRQSFREGR